MRAETKEFGDIVRLDSTDTYADLARKTLKLFSKLPTNLMPASTSRWVSLEAARQSI